MAICYWDAKLLWSAYLNGVRFDKTLTLGHLSLFLYRAELASLRGEYIKKFPGSKPLAGYEFGVYSDDFLSEYLKVKEQVIMDASSYEGAMFNHDLNDPIPSFMKNAFDAVIECGTLEHVFNFPVAITNLMLMTKPGGLLYISTPSNNLCGHGFYQFSPELMFRVFTKANGFELKRVMLTEARFPSTEMSQHRDIYEVTDPEKVQTRVGLISSGPVTMMVEAVKVKDVIPFSSTPMQSDYVAAWSGMPKLETKSRVGGMKILQSLYKMLPHKIAIYLSGMRQKMKFSFANKRQYRKIKEFERFA